MSRSQRLGFLAVAAIIAVVAIVLFTRGDATTDTAGTPTRTPASQDRSQAESGGKVSPTPQATPAVKTLVAGKLQKIEVTQGDEVSFKVKADKADEVHLHGYDIKKDAAAGQTITFGPVKADITGVFEIEFENQGEQIGSLVVEPK